MEEIQFAKKKDFLADGNIKFKNSDAEKSIKDSISQVGENNYLMIKCEKLNSPLVVVNAVPVTEELLKQKLTL